MGNEFIINKSGYSLEELESKFDFKQTEQISYAKDSKEFEANYKEPDVVDVKDGVVSVYDSSAKAAFEKLFAKNQEENGGVYAEEFSRVSVSFSNAEPDPTCGQ